MQCMFVGWWAVMTCMQIDLHTSIEDSCIINIMWPLLCVHAKKFLSLYVYVKQKPLSIYTASLC